MNIHIKVQGDVAKINSLELERLVQFLRSAQDGTKVSLDNLELQAFGDRNVTDDDVQLICRRFPNQKIDAIKALRELYQEKTGESLGLKEAKDWVEKYLDNPSRW